MKKIIYILSIITVSLLLSSCGLTGPSETIYPYSFPSTSINLVSSQNCPKGTWNRNQYSGPGGGLYTGIGGGLYTGIGGGMYTGVGGGMYTGPGGGMYTGPGGGLYTGPIPYCSKRPPLHILRQKGIIN